MCCSPADGGEISNGKERRGARFEDGSPGEGGQAAGERGELMIFGILAMLIIFIMEILAMVMMAMKLVILRMMVHLEREGGQLEREVNS